MTREEAKCVIKDMLDDAEKYGDIDYWDLSDFISACKVAIEALSDVPDINVGKWIPVSERLPDAMQTVLLCDNEGFVDVGYWSRIDNGWCGDDGMLIELASRRHIIAWMPLPNPYKGEKDV